MRHVTPVAVLVVALGAPGDVRGQATPEDAKSGAPIGDGTSRRVEVANPSIHDVTWRVVGADARGHGVDGALGGHASTVLDVQCVRGAGGGEPPRLEVEVDHRRRPISAPPVRLPDGAPVVWVVGEDAPSSGVGALLERFGPVVRIAPRAVPEHFGPLRFAAAIVMSSTDAAQLSAAQVEALKDAALVGATVVVAMGDDAQATSPWLTMGGVALGESSTPGASLAVEAPSAVKARPLLLSRPERARALFEADGQVVVAEVPVGLGRCRLVSLPLEDLSAGALASSALGLARDEATRVQGAMASVAPVLPPGQPPFGGWPLAALGALVPLIVVAGRARGRVAAGLGIAWCGVAMSLPVVGPRLSAEDATALVVDASASGARNPALWRTDWTHGVGGTTAAQLPVGEWSLEAATPGGACLVRTTEGTSLWLRGEPGSRSRVWLWAASSADRWTNGDALDGEASSAAGVDGLWVHATPRRVERVDGLLGQPVNGVAVQAP